MIPNPGDRVRMTGTMPNDPCPVEIGAMGTVVAVGPKIQGVHQIDVTWDNGRKLYLLDTDPFVVVHNKKTRRNAR